MPTFEDQRKLVEALADYHMKMKGKDYDDFEMIRKRIRDEEELDRMTMERLEALKAKYLPPNMRSWY